MITAICNYYGIEAGAAEIACDGKDALEQALRPENRITSTSQHFDMLTSIRSLLQECPIQMKDRHVRGHQDDHNIELDRWELLNVEMDFTAKELWAEGKRQQRIGRDTLAGEPWSVWIEYRKLTRNVDEQVYDFIHGKNLQKHWTEKEHPRLSPESFGIVDWAGTEQAMKAAPSTRRQWISKHVSGFCSVGRQAKRWKIRDSDKCPRCGQEETTTHVWLCPNPAAIRRWTTATALLKKDMRRMKTAPPIIDAICKRLRQWRCNLPLEAIPTTLPRLREALELQDLIGWDHFLEGALVTHWQEAQASYLTRIGSRRTSLRWISALIRKLWDVAWDQWDHRNHVLHETENVVTHDERETTALQIRREFLTGKGLLPASASPLFYGTVERILNKTIPRQQQWLKYVHEARARQHRRVQSSWPPERALLLRWLRQQKDPNDLNNTR